LLDLTMRNGLLNFRPTKRRAIRVVDEIPREIYNILVLDEKQMEFLPRPKASGGGRGPVDQQGLLDGLEGDTSGLTEEESSRMWELPPRDYKVADRHVDRFLQTALESDALQKKLFYMYQESRSIVEEAGYSILYLATGFLEWTESKSPTEIRKAPLILIPVELERVGAGTAFRLHWAGEDMSTNVSLQATLSQQGVSLPDFEMPDSKEDIDEYFHSVSEAVLSMPGWQVVNDIYLGFFSFTKFILYKDLDPNGWPEGMSPSTAPLIRALFDPSYQREPESEFVEEESDERLRASDLYHVMDADPSQIAAIEDTKSGRNMVVEGPPRHGQVADNNEHNC